MAIYWPTSSLKGRTFKLCVLTRWDFNFCVRSSPQRGWIREGEGSFVVLGWSRYALQVWRNILFSFFFFCWFYFDDRRLADQLYQPSTLWNGKVTRIAWCPCRPLLALPFSSQLYRLGTVSVRYCQKLIVPLNTSPHFLHTINHCQVMCLVVGICGQCLS